MQKQTAETDLNQRYCQVCQATTIVFIIKTIIQIFHTSISKWRYKDKETFKTSFMQNTWTKFLNIFKDKHSSVQDIKSGHNWALSKYFQQNVALGTATSFCSHVKTRIGLWTSNSNQTQMYHKSHINNEVSCSYKWLHRQHETNYTPKKITTK